LGAVPLTEAVVTINQSGPGVNLDWH